MTDALATVTPALAKDRDDRPDTSLLRKALRLHSLLPKSRREELPLDAAAALRWLEEASLPLTDLANAETVRQGPDAVALNLDGTAAAATTHRRKRSVFYNVLQYAVELELLDFNPVDKLRVSANRKKVAEVVDRRSVVNPRQARELLIAVSYVGSRGKHAKRGERLAAFFACLHFAALRPGEALSLRAQNCYLPKKGSGSLTVERSHPAAGKRYTDRAGHSADVLLKVYAKCIDGDRDTMNARIEFALAA
ncbi:hypothetical protein AB0M36_36425 [Actinoplanes sp. NPDC051346]|uniref:hypothetical protein n=1 Tax=Actinoplanes sp. NPDC051346 TaxID=3155048 RepID=UPI0034243C34